MAHRDLELFLEGKQLRNLQSSSIELYRRDLSELLAFQSRREILESLKTRKPRTRLRKLTIWNSYLRWLTTRNETEALKRKEWLRDLEPPKIPRQQPKILTQESVKLMRHALQHRDPLSNRLRLIFNLGVDLGLRLSEILNLTWKDVEVDWLRIIRKGGHEQKLPLSTSLKMDFQSLRQISAYTRPEDFVFARSLEARLTPRAVQLAFERIATRIQLPQKLTPHVLRHTFATQMALEGTPLHVLKEILGHRSLATTERYLHVLPTHVQEAFHRIRK